MTTPFDVVHVDAHADLGLGFGDLGWFHLAADLLHRTREERAVENPPGLTEGNYLLYAVACGWIESLTYVAHPRRGRLDLAPVHFADDRALPEILGDEALDLELQLRRCERGVAIDRLLAGAEMDLDRHGCALPR